VEAAARPRLPGNTTEASTMQPVAQSPGECPGLEGVCLLAGYGVAERGIAKELEGLGFSPVSRGSRCARTGER